MTELFLHFGYLPTPYTFFQNTTQVAPGEIVEVQAGEVQSRRRFHQFSAQTWSHTGIELEQLDRTLQDSVRLRKISDVPLGAFLSGGIDSALVAANLQDVPTFTVAFDEQAHNEVDAAAETATELGLPHTRIRIDESQLSDLAMDYLDCYEQPYADTSGLVTMLLCQAVKQHVTVALSGDGGDEFFGGYARYRWFQKALLAQRFPTFARRLLARAGQSLDQRRGDRLARWLMADDPAGLYAAILRNWNATEFEELIEPQATPMRPLEMVRDVFARVDADPLSQAACFDATHYIPDDLQVKLDRASMRFALEVRCPLLDYRFANLGVALNSSLKYRGGLKSTLKQALSRHVSDRVLKRPKHGFNVPLAKWLRGPLRELVHSTLDQQVFQECGWIRQQTVQQVYRRFLAGQTQYAHSLWMLFNLAHHVRPVAADARFRSLLEPSHGRRQAA